MYSLQSQKVWRVVPAWVKWSRMIQAFLRPLPFPPTKEERILCPWLHKPTCMHTPCYHDFEQPPVSDCALPSPCDLKFLRFGSVHMACIHKNPSCGTDMRLFCPGAHKDNWPQQTQPRSLQMRTPCCGTHTDSLPLPPLS